jgi:hypothetical protein
MILAGVVLGAVAARGDVSIPLPLANLPSDLTVNPITHDVWVTSEHDDAIVVIDGDDLSVTAIPLSDQPFRARLDPVRNRIWISHGIPLISVVDGVTHAVSTVALPYPSRLAIDPFLGVVYASAASVSATSALLSIDADTLAVTTVPTPAAGTIAIDPMSDAIGTLTYDAGLDHFFANRLAGSPPALVDSVPVFASLPDARNLSFDTHTGRAIVENFSGVPFVIDWEDGVLFPDDFFGFSSYAVVTEPTAGRTWVPSNDPFTCGGSFLYVFDTATLAQHGSNAFVPCFDRVAVNPATRRAYTSSIVDVGELLAGVSIVDADTTAVTPHALPDYQAAWHPAVDVAANRLYVTAYRNFPTVANDVVAIDDLVTAPVPLDVAISVDPIIAGLDPVVRFHATSGFAPYPLPIRQVYFQVDATDGAWSYTDATGPTSSTTLTGLAPGVHTVHAFATDGQEVTTSPASATPIVGPIASLEIVVPAPPACSNGEDDDGDGLVDHPADPGCASALATNESPACDDGTDNDGDGAVDHPADPDCATPWDGERQGSGGCGLGAELAVLLFALRSLRRS